MKAIKFNDNWFNWQDLGQHLLEKVGTIILTSVLFWLFWRLGRRMLQKYLLDNKKAQAKMTQRSKTISTLTINIFQYTILLFYFYTILSLLGLPIGTLLASAGIFSLAIGMGAQGFVSDIVNGFFILSEGQFDVGDVVQIDEEVGNVIALGLRTTQLKSTDGTVIYIPNRQIKTVRNLTRGGIGVNLDLQLLAENDLTLVESTLNHVNESLEGKLPQIINGPTLVGVTDQIGSSLNYRIHFQVSAGSESLVKDVYFKHYIQALQKVNVTFASTNLLLS